MWRHTVLLASSNIPNGNDVGNYVGNYDEGDYVCDYDGHYDGAYDGYNERFISPNPLTLAVCCVCVCGGDDDGGISNQFPPSALINKHKCGNITSCPLFKIKSMVSLLPFSSPAMK